MSTQAPSMEAAVRQAGATGDVVWDRIWSQPPSAEKDATLLARELRSRRWSLITARLTREFGSLKGLRTIELGSGRGDLSVLLAQRGARVTLLDVNDSALSRARSRLEGLGLSADYVKGDLLAPDASWSSKFDVSLSSGVIEHFRGAERAEAVRAHHTALRTGGLAVVAVPYAWCVPYRIWKCYLELRSWWPYGMEIPYSRRELRKCARRVGFENAETWTMGFLQSIGVHWWQRVVGGGVRPEWADSNSRLDSMMGLVLLLMARRA